VRGIDKADAIKKMTADLIKEKEKQVRQERAEPKTNKNSNNTTERREKDNSTVTL
jgi:hypothetical protein